MTKANSLSFREKAGYALGDSACNFYWKTFEFFLLFFYTDVFGISPIAAGTMFAVTRIWDGLVDPIMGLLADRTNTRWGKFRPYLLWFAVPNAVAGVLTFTTPGLSGGGKLVYAYITYSLTMLAFTAINIPYSSLMGVMTSDSRERTSLSSFRFVGAFSTCLVVVYFTKKLVAVFGGSDATRGWQLTMGLWGLLATLMFIVCFASTKERVQPLVSHKSDVKAELKDLAHNGPWLVLLGLGVIIMTSFWIRSAATMYYFKYSMHREDLFESFAVASAFANILGIGLTTPLSRLLGGKRMAYIATMGCGALLVMLFYFVPPTNIALVFVLTILTSALLGPQSPLLWAMYADTVDYSEWRTGRRTTGLIFAAATFSLKVGSAFAGWITGLLLSRFGYAANQAQSSDSLQGILLLMSVVPGILMLAAAGLVLFYSLDDAAMNKIGTDLETRRNADQAGQA